MKITNVIYRTFGNRFTLINYTECLVLNGFAETELSHSSGTIFTLAKLIKFAL